MGKRQRRRTREQREVVTPIRRDLQAGRDDDGEATARLKLLVEQRAQIQTEIDAEVDCLEGWGFDWPTIGRALGVTRQAARQRHRRLQAQRLATAGLPDEI
jgi:hypothetical protein